MLAFIVAVTALLIFAVVLAHKLHHPADHLGLHAARAAVVADMSDRVAEEQAAQHRRLVARQWADVFALVLAVEEKHAA